MLCTVQGRGRGRMECFAAFKQMTNVHIRTSLSAPSAFSLVTLIWLGAIYLFTFLGGKCSKLTSLGN